MQIHESNTTEPTASYPNIYTPIPPNGKRCQYTGLAHAYLYRLLSQGGLAHPHVRTAQLRQPGAAKGKTVFHVGDFLTWLDAVAQQQASPPQPSPRATAGRSKLSPK